MKPDEDTEEPRTPIGEAEDEPSPKDAPTGPQAGPQATQSRTTPSTPTQKPKAARPKTSSHVREAAREAADRLGDPGGPTKTLQRRRLVEKGLANGIPHAVLARLAGVTTRQVRRIAAAVKAEWANRAHDDYLDKALTRIRGDAEDARKLGGTKGLAVALKAERLAADLVGVRVGIAKDPGSLDAEHMDDEELLEAVAASATLYDRLRAGHQLTTGEPDPEVIDMPLSVDPGFIVADQVVLPRPVPAPTVTETIVTERSTVTERVEVRSYSEQVSLRAYARARGLPEPRE